MTWLPPAHVVVGSLLIAQAIFNIVLYKRWRYAETQWGKWQKLYYRARYRS